jgi:hypothetical protein
MKTFKSFVNEETMPYAVTDRGSINIDDHSVVDGLNALLAGVTKDKVVTPYIAYERVQKALANFLIFPPRPTFLEGDSGVYVHNINQFGNKIGMTDSGEFKKDTDDDSEYALFFEYQTCDCGMYNVFCQVVTQDELDELMDDINEDI